MAQWISHLLIAIMLMARTLPSIVMRENVVGTSRNQDLTTHCQVTPVGQCVEEKEGSALSELKKIVVILKFMLFSS